MKNREFKGLLQPNIKNNTPGPVPCGGSNVVSSNKTQLTESLTYIKYQLSGIETEDLTKAERNILNYVIDKLSSID